MRPVRLYLRAQEFLTRLPVPSLPPPTANELGQAALAFPAVGLVIGACLALVAAGLPGGGVAAVLVLGAWIVLTGALHLDGLADSADAWMAGGDRERALAVMKDPRCGPGGVVAVAWVLAAKLVALAALLDAGATALLLLIPMLARAGLLGILLTTPYARDSGWGSPYRQHLPQAAARAMLALAMIVGLFWLPVVTLAVAAIVLVCRTAMIRLLKGYTGDTLGATCELTETAALLAAALFAT